MNPPVADPTPARITGVEPAWAVVGARVTLVGVRLPVTDARLPTVRVGGAQAQVVMASPGRVGLLVPDTAPGGRQAVTVDGVAGQADLDVGTPLASGVHAVDNPAFGPDGALYVTFSGPRGQRVPVSVFRVSPAGVKEPYLTDIANATSLAFDATGVLHVSSRFDGCVYRVMPDRTLETVASDLGVTCGIAFGSDRTMFVGDRSGTVFRIGSSSHAIPFVSLPPSIAAFHLAMGPRDTLYVSGPTFATCDRIHRVSRQGEVSVVSAEFGRPQGMAVDADGQLYVVEGLAGRAGLYRVREGRPRELLLAAPSLVGVAIDPRGGLVVSSSTSVYRLDVGLRPWRPR